MNLARALKLLAAGAVLAASTPARAQSPAYAVVDSGRLVVFLRGEPVATEDFMYEQRHDSLFVTSQIDRHARASDGTTKKYLKSMQLIANAEDWNTLVYVSTEQFDGHKVNRVVTPADTTILVTTERDFYGAADQLARPPGRLYVMDAGLYTLFDVLARNLHGRIFASRPISIVALGDRTLATTAIATPAGKDTLQWGHKRVITDRIVVGDSTGTYTLWVSPAGRLLRLESATIDFVVLREAPAVPAASRRRRPR